MSESHEDLEHALQLEVTSGNRIYQEMNEMLLYKEFQVAHCTQSAALKTRALIVWFAAFRHQKFCRSIAVGRAESKKLRRSALTWQNWLMLNRQRQKMICRSDYWKRSKDIAIILKRHAGQRSLRKSFWFLRHAAKRRRLTNPRNQPSRSIRPPPTRTMPTANRLAKRRNWPSA